MATMVPRRDLLKVVKVHQVEKDAIIVCYGNIIQVVTLQGNPKQHKKLVSQLNFDFPFKLALGDDAYKAHISSIKGSIGHMLGAAGAVEAVATVLALKNGIVPPTINLDEIEPECDLNYTPNKPVKADLTIAMSDSLGFGGHNSCVVFRKYNG